MKINIYDVYVTRIFTMIQEDYNSNGLRNVKGKFARTTIVVKQTNNNNIYFLDLLSGNKVKSDVNECRVGEEYINYEMYEPITNYISFNKDKPFFNMNINKKTISKDKLLRMVKEKTRKEVKDEKGI